MLDEFDRVEVEKRGDHLILAFIKGDKEYSLCLADNQDIKLYAKDAAKALAGIIQG